jgi:hypothetical protein
MRIRCIELQEPSIDFLVAPVKEHVIDARSEANETLPSNAKNSCALQ